MHWVSGLWGLAVACLTFPTGCALGLGPLWPRCCLTLLYRSQPYLTLVLLSLSCFIVSEPAIPDVLWSPRTKEVPKEHQRSTKALKEPPGPTVCALGLGPLGPRRCLPHFSQWVCTGSRASVASLLPHFALSEPDIPDLGSPVVIVLHCFGASHS